MNKRVCIIRSNPVNPDSRVEKEAYSLHKAGYNVHILAWDRESRHNAQDSSIEVAGEEIAITRLGFPASYGVGFKSLKSYLGFQLAMRKWLRNNHNRIDIIHACDFDTAFFSYGIAKQFNKKFIFDIFDFLYAEPHNLIQKCINFVEKYIINNADATFICTEQRKKQINGSNPKELVIIENTPSEVTVVANRNKLVRVSSRIKIAYVGILQDYRLLPELGHYFVTHNEYEFHVGGFGKYEEMYKELDNRCDNIFYYGQIAYQDTIQLEKDCDIMIAIYDPRLENHRNAAPNKFYESLMLGKPIIMVRGTGMAEEVEIYNLGKLMDYSIESFDRAINELVSEKGKWGQLGENAKRCYYEQHNWAIMSQRLLDCYSRL